LSVVPVASELEVALKATVFLYHKIRAWRPAIFCQTTFELIDVLLFTALMPFPGKCLMFLQSDKTVAVLVQSLEKLPRCLLTLARGGLLAPILGHKFL
jgi:hypothetical protein